MSLRPAFSARVENGGFIIAATMVLSLIIASSRKPVPPTGLILVVAFVEALLPQHLVELEGVSGVDRIDHHRLALDVGERLDLGLHHQMVEAVVAAEHDRDIDIGLVLEREGIVDRRMRDLVAALGQPVAQFIRIRRELEIDGKPALGVEALGLRREHRQVLHPRENDDGELGVFGARVARRDRDSKNRGKRGGEQAFHHGVLPDFRFRYSTITPFRPRHSAGRRPIPSRAALSRRNRWDRRRHPTISARRLRGCRA